MDLVKKNTVAGACKSEALKNALALGAVYRYIYFDETPRSLGGFDVAKADCAQ